MFPFYLLSVDQLTLSVDLVTESTVVMCCGFCFVSVFIGVQLLYEVVFVSAVQQSGMSYNAYTCTPALCHHRALSRVPCAGQLVLITFGF